MRAFPVLLVVVALLAGCVKPEEPTADAATLDPAAAPSPPAATTAATGSLVVLVRMPDLTPLAAATVEAANLTRVTGPDGVARFEAISAGEWNVTVRKEAHRTAQLAARIVAGQTTEIVAELPPLGQDQHSHERGVLVHRDLYAFDGHFDCSATYVIITGDCLVVVDNASSQAGLPQRPGEATSERNIIDFPLDVTWATLIVEMAWSADPTTPATGEGMSLALEPAEAPADGHAARYARVAGASPLRVELAPGVKHPTATADDMPRPEGGEVIRARAFVLGAAHNPAGTTFLGVGAAKDVRFTLYVSIFYGEGAPEGYSAVPRGA